MIKRELYVLEENKLARQRRFCPRCGPGVFLGEHKDRYSCGRCGYTEFKKDARPKDSKPKAAVPKTEPKETPAAESKAEAPKESKPKEVSKPKSAKEE